MASGLPLAILQHSVELAPTWMQVLHLLGADLYRLALTCLAAEILRPDERLTA
jgi:hypothetical protein